MTPTPPISQEIEATQGGTTAEKDQHRARYSSHHFANIPPIRPAFAVLPIGPRFCLV